MWHMTRDTWHLTCDMFGGVNILSKFQLPSSYRLWFMILWRSGGKGWLGELMNHEAVYRTAPATPGLLKIEDHIWTRKILGKKHCFLEMVSFTVPELYWKNLFWACTEFCTEICTFFGRVDTRLLSSWPLGKILTGPVHYRVTLDTFGEYPEPWFSKILGSDRERTY